VHRSEQLPKGLDPFPEAPTGEDDRPAPLTLADGNYAGVLRKLLQEAFPWHVHIERLLVSEKPNAYPEVRLKLTILGEREEVPEIE